MSNASLTRKAGFKSALTLAGLTAKEWCAKEEITEGHLYQVLAGKRDSEPLLRRVDAFIARYSKHHVAA